MEIEVFRPILYEKSILSHKLQQGLILLIIVYLRLGYLKFQVKQIVINYFTLFLLHENHNVHQSKI